MEAVPSKKMNFSSYSWGPSNHSTRRSLRNPNIVAVRFIGPFIKASFINETFTKKHFITTLIESSEKVRAVYLREMKFLPCSRQISIPGI